MTDHKIRVKDWARLTQLQRVRRCCTLAGEAQELSANSQGVKHETYHKICLDWLKLADEIARSGEGRK